MRVPERCGLSPLRGYVKSGGVTQVGFAPILDRMSIPQDSLVVVAVASLPFVLLTISGARKRGNGRAASGVAGLFFPITWIAWYLRDEHPYQR